jgi:ABC-type bacteriocin/lantibiotic exporter with double-glycine peptidase domain
MNWPSEGRIVIRNLEVRYADDLPAVLHDIDLEIQVRDP